MSCLRKTIIPPFLLLVHVFSKMSVLKTASSFCLAFQNPAVSVKTLFIPSRPSYRPNIKNTAGRLSFAFRRVTSTRLSTIISILRRNSLLLSVIPRVFSSNPMCAWRPSWPSPFRRAWTALSGLTSHTWSWKVTIHIPFTNLYISLHPSKKSLSSKDPSIPARHTVYSIKEISQPYHPQFRLDPISRRNVS